MSYNIPLDLLSEFEKNGGKLTITEALIQQYLDQAYEAGYKAGYDADAECNSDQNTWYSSGYEAGYDAGYQNGYDTGFNSGVANTIGCTLEDGGYPLSELEIEFTENPYTVYCDLKGEDADG